MIGFTMEEKGSFVHDFLETFFHLFQLLFQNISLGSSRNHLRLNHRFVVSTGRTMQFFDILKIFQ